MDLISQKEQARLITQATKYVPSKPCTVCGLPTGTAALKCIHCLQKAILAEELAFTRQWLVDHPNTLLVVGHDKHDILHLALLRKPLLGVGWCGGHISQKRENRRQAKIGEFPVLLPEKIVAYPAAKPKPFCGLCLEAWERMGLRP